MRLLLLGFMTSFCGTRLLSVPHRYPTGYARYSTLMWDRMWLQMRAFESCVSGLICASATINHNLQKVTLPQRASLFSYKTELLTTATPKVISQELKKIRHCRPSRRSLGAKIMSNNFSMNYQKITTINCCKGSQGIVISFNSSQRSYLMAPGSCFNISYPLSLQSQADRLMVCSTLWC